MKYLCGRKAHFMNVLVEAVLIVVAILSFQYLVWIVPWSESSGAVAGNELLWAESTPTPTADSPEQEPLWGSALATPDSAASSEAPAPSAEIAAQAYVELTPDALWRAELFRDVGCAKLQGRSPDHIHDVEDINVDWRDAGPFSNMHDNFCVKWSRNIHFEGGTYLFWGTVDDYLWLYIDSVDDRAELAEDNDPLLFQKELNISPGVHRLIVYSQENWGMAKCVLQWKHLPDKVTSPVSTPASCEWRGEYFARSDFTGSLGKPPVEPWYSFIWQGELRNASSMQWIRDCYLEKGYYEFGLKTDNENGIVEAYLDDGHRQTLVVRGENEEWETQKREVKDGQHRLILQYRHFGGEASFRFYIHRLD